jgi:nickel transport protein
LYYDFCIRNTKALAGLAAIRQLPPGPRSPPHQFTEFKPSIQVRYKKIAVTRLHRFLPPLPRRFTAALLLLLLVQGFAVPVEAHEMRHRLSHGEAVTVQFLLPGDNHPLFEPYEVFAPDMESPFQTGRTNARGEVTFRPGQAGEWRVRIATGDGHGAVVRINLDEAGEVSWQEGRAASQLERILAALGYLFGLFGLLAIWRVRAAGRRRR